MRQSRVEVVDAERDVVVTMSRDDYFVFRSLIAETVFFGDPRDFQTRTGVTTEEAQELLKKLTDIGA